MSKRTESNMKRREAPLDLEDSKSSDFRSEEIQPKYKRVNKQSSSFQDLFAKQPALKEKKLKILSFPTTEIQPQAKSADDVFGIMISKSISSIPESEDKEELKIEIQGLILQTKRRIQCF